MKNSVKTLLAVGTILGSIAVLSATPAMAQPRGFSFRVGDVAFGYTDGYYDRSRQWHRWSSRERQWYSTHYRTNYRSMRHDRDHDGISDRFDRDRDNDGVPNNRDRAPNNPNRR